MYTQKQYDIVNKATENMGNEVYDIKKMKISSYDKIDKIMKILDIKGIKQNYPKTKFLGNL